MTTTGFLDYFYLSSNEWTVFLCSLLAVLWLPALRRRLSAPSSNTNVNGLPSPPCLPSLPVVGSLPFIFGLKDLREPKALLDALTKFCLLKSKEMGSAFSFYMNSRYTLVINGRKSLVEALAKTAFSGRTVWVLEKLYTNPNALGQSFDPKDVLYQCVVGVTLGFLFGRSFESDDPLLRHIHVFVTAINENVGNLEVCPALRFWPSTRASIKRVMKYTEQLFQLTDAETDNCLSCGREDSFVYKYVQLKGPQSAHSDELHYIIRDLYIGGSDTSLSTLRWAFSMIADMPDVQEKLHKQIDDLYGNETTMPSLADIVKLPYVEATIHETMRKETLAAGANPHLVLEDVEFQGYFVPKGTIVIPNLLSTHMDPDEWDNPAEFSPERFIGADGKLVNTSRILPFSTGKRACLGEQLARQQIFIITTGIMRHFTLSPPEGQSRIDVRRASTNMNEPSDYHIRMIARTSA